MEHSGVMGKYFIYHFYHGGSYIAADIYQSYAPTKGEFHCIEIGYLSEYTSLQTKGKKKG